jgi:hypothetical protein
LKAALSTFSELAFNWYIAESRQIGIYDEFGDTAFSAECMTVDDSGGLVDVADLTN